MSFLIQLGKCPCVVHLHRSEIKRLDSAKAYLDCFLNWYIFLYMHSSNYLQTKNLLTPFSSGFTENRAYGTYGILSTIDEDFVIGEIFIDLSKAFASAGHQLTLQNFRDLRPCSGCIKWFALTWGIVQERKPGEHRFQGITNGMPEGVFYFLCLTIILWSNVFSPLCTCELMI